MRLIASNGVAVEASVEVAERLLASGFRKADAPAGKTEQAKKPARRTRKKAE